MGTHWIGQAGIEFYYKPYYNTLMDHREVARMGGLAVLKKYGRNHFKEIRKKRKNYSRKSSKQD